MIDFQSSAIAKNASYWPCHYPSPVGEGELYRGRQSALIKMGRCRQARCSRAVLKSFSMANTSKLRNESIFQSGMVQAGSIQGFPRPFKAIKGYPSLFKGFSEKNCLFYGRRIPYGRSSRVKLRSRGVKLSQAVWREKKIVYFL
jgi:hypothetical protein